MANQQFLDALQEQDKVAFIQNLIDSSAGGNTLTGDQIRSLLDAVADTNIFDDASKQTINDLVLSTQGGTYTAGDPMNMDPDLTTAHTASSVPIVLTQPQVLPATSIEAMASNTLISVGSTFKAIQAFGINTMTEKGIVSRIDDIVETGIYEGTDVLGSPVSGKVIIEVYADQDNDLDISLKGSDGRRYEGGKPHGGIVHWSNVTPDHLFGIADPDNADGNDGDIYFQYTV